MTKGLCLTLGILQQYPVLTPIVHNSECAIVLTYLFKPNSLDFLGSLL